MAEERLRQQLHFILEMDKAKEIFRQTYIASGKRKENDAEHSWHLAVMAFTLAEYFPKTVNLLKVIKMVLMHDLVEVYAGDTYCYDKEGYQDKEEREQAAAEKIYSLLPGGQGQEYHALWEEFEAAETEEAKFANILDRIQPLLLNYATNGQAWIEHGIYSDQVLGRNQVVLDGPVELASLLKDIVRESEEKGYLKKREY